VIKSKIVDDDDEDSEKDESTTRLYGVNACYGLHKKLSQFDSFQYLSKFHASW
jgi:hypothetical protein